VVILIICCSLTGLAVLWLAYLVRDYENGLTDRSVGSPLSWRIWLLLLWVFSSPAFATWMQTSLMETALWMFLVVGCSVCLLRQTFFHPLPPTAWQMRLAGLLILLTLTRPESLLLGPIFVALSIAIMVQSGASSRDIFRRAALPAGASAFAIAGLIAFRLVYFGYPLPNTYYAKMSPDLGYRLGAGARYVGEFLLSNWLLPVVAGLSALAFTSNLVSTVRALAGRSELAGQLPEAVTPLRGFQTAGSIAVVGILLPIYGGGDHFGLFRFHQPFWPILGLLIIFAIDSSGLLDSRRLTSQTRWRRGLAIVLTGAVLYAANVPRWDSVEFREAKIALHGRRTGRALDQVAERVGRFSVGAVMVGGLGLEYSGPTVDLLGLNNITMGHSPGDRRGPRNHAAFDKETFWTLQPDAVVPEFVSDVAAFDIDSVVEALHYELYLKGLLRDPEFKQAYVPCLVGVPGRPIIEDPWFFLPSPITRLLRGHLDLHPRSGLFMFCGFSLLDELSASGLEVRQLGY